MTPAGRGAHGAAEPKGTWGDAGSPRASVRLTLSSHTHRQGHGRTCVPGCTNVCALRVAPVKPAKGKKVVILWDKSVSNKLVIEKGRRVRVCNCTGFDKK